MAVSAASAVRAWINGKAGLTGKGNPISRGAYLAGRAPRSPADGCYALLIREPGAIRGVVAESFNPSVARITAHCFGPSIESAEAAAVALSNAWQALRGCPEPCGTTGITILVADNHTDPGYIPMPPSGGEVHAFTVSADFTLLAPD